VLPLSFGFSVGDLIAMANLIRGDLLIRQANLRLSMTSESYYTVSQRGPTYFSVLGLKTCQMDPNDALSQLSTRSYRQKKTRLQEITHSCHNVLTDLEKTVDKYQRLDNTSK
jgi:hypothetical protein